MQSVPRSRRDNLLFASVCITFVTSVASLGVLWDTVWLLVLVSAVQPCCFMLGHERGAEVRVKSLDPSSLEEMQVLVAFVACWNAGV